MSLETLVISPHCLDHQLVNEIASMGPAQAIALLDPLSDAEASRILEKLSPAISEDILLALSEERRQALISAAPKSTGKQWAVNFTCPEDSIGRLMESPHAIFRPETTVEEAIERIRKLVKNVFVTYGFIVDQHDRLIGLIVMRDLLLADRYARLEQIMLRNPFALHVNQTVLEAMKLVVSKHFPVYPVCDSDGKLVGTLRGRTLFEEHAIEISAQVGSMVGVEKEERLSTPWQTSLRYRHPWLQLNLLTAFVAAGVVGFFQSTIDSMVILAVFLPVLAGQSGNTGCQSMAVTLRGLTLGELKSGRERALVTKEGMLGLLNGTLVGLTSGLGMMILAFLQNNPQAFWLGVIVFFAMMGSCIISGIAGALIPLALRRMGADPATASSIFLTTATDVASMGLFLSLATLIV
jgi:magnesium transporter